MSDVQVQAEARPVSTSVAVAAGYVAGYESGFTEGFDNGYASNNSAGVLLSGMVIGAAVAVWGFLVMDSIAERKKQDGK